MKSLLLTSVLSSLSLSSASNVEIKETSSLSGHHEVFAQLKRQAQEKLSVPKSFAEKIQKTTNLKLKELSLSQAELQKLHESNDLEETNLRGLKIKNNFFQFTYYADGTCSTPHTTFGEILNTCSNVESKSSGVERSYLIKVNKKENLLVGLEYEEPNCRGIPSKVTNLLGDTAFPGWSTCTSFEDSGITYSYAVDYLSNYPSLGSGNFVELGSLEEYCSTTENKNYQSFYIVGLDKLIPLGCVPSDEYFIKYSTSSCATEGQLYLSVYTDSLCSTTPVFTDGVFGPPCTAGTDDDDDDGADDDDEDDDYVEIGVVETTKCT